MHQDAQATFFDDPAEWRAWLAEHHDTDSELWLGFWKKSAGGQGLTYEEAVDQALCFGWIDGVLNRIDDRRHRIRFTPRRAGSSWSKVNVDKVAVLERQGLMTDAGRAAHEAGRSGSRGVYAYVNDEEVELAPAYAERLAASPEALGYFESETPSYRRTVKRWVMSAKRQETRDRRMAELLADCAAGRRIKAMRVDRNNPPR